MNTYELTVVIRIEAQSIGAATQLVDAALESYRPEEHAGAWEDDEEIPLLDQWRYQQVILV